ncbi:hypothetical protein ABEG18_02385 [Alsobacter sp. KACC 23698]|uniref:Uncharacterized protein n=1 Tax=Alsobacter sp. KACC 23698 TaxID=3149229 RepID=A0AAU7JH82_9HYPH
MDGGLVVGKQWVGRREVREGARRWAPRLGAMVLGAALALPWAEPASARECTWGQPGYRDCVDGEIAHRSRRVKSGDRSAIYKTAPVRRRPGTLTPIEPVPGPQPSRVDGRPIPSQEHRLDAISRQNMRRDAIPNPIQAPDPRINTIPGRICPNNIC